MWSEELLGITEESENFSTAEKELTERILGNNAEC